MDNSTPHDEPRVSHSPTGPSPPEQASGRSASALSSKLAALIRLACWLALSYLGHWVALVLDRAAAQLLAWPLANAPVYDVEADPFSLFLSNELRSPGPYARIFLEAGPLVVAALFIATVWSWGRRPSGSPLQSRSEIARGSYLLGLWGALNACVIAIPPVAFLAWVGRGRYARLFTTVTGVPPSIPARVAIATLVGVAIVLSGRMCARRLLEAWRLAVIPTMRSKEGFGRGLAAFTGLVLPVLFILAAPFLFPPTLAHGFREVFWLVLPGAGFLLMALLAHIPRSRSGAGGLALPCPLPIKQGVATVAAAALLFAGLQVAGNARRWATEAKLSKLSFEHYDIEFLPSSFGEDSIRSLAKERERVLSDQAARLQASLGTLRLRLVLYKDFDSLRAATRDPRAYAVDGGTIRALLGGHVQALDPAADALALLESFWGKPATPTVAAWSARWLAGNWRGAPLTAWRARLESETGRRTLAELLEGGEQNQISRLEREPLGGAWIGIVAERYGLAAARKLYENKDAESLAGAARLLGTTPVRLADDWARSAPPAAAAQEARDEPPPPIPPDFYFRGISFSHEGWQNGRGGYASEGAFLQLAMIHQLGANAVALVPYGFVPDSGDPSVRYTTTDETDEDLAEAASRAHQLGMLLMLKPQLWVSFGQFTGHLQLDDPAARAGWMKSYREFLLHYARLAEINRFELLAIGTELEGLTAYPQEWRALIAEVRRVYHGRLTYAAHFGKEFETLAFWDALDYLGLNNYYSLADAPGRGVAEMLPRAQALAGRLAAISARWQKPILFTEAGYPSARGGTSEPWIEGDGRAVGLEEQAAGYEATFRAFTGQPWFRGMFWWKWPSDGKGGGPGDTSFTLLGKPAAEVVKKWFHQPVPTSSADPLKAQ